MTRRWLAVALLLGIALSLHAQSSVEGSFDRTLKVTGPVDLTVRTGSGSIDVHRGPAQVVTIHGRIRANAGWFSGDVADRVKKIEANPPIEQDGNVIRIGQDTDSWLLRNISISYEITVPQDTKLEAHSGSGSQTVQGVKGPVDVKAGSGGIHLTDIGSDAQASTGSGSVEVSNVQGAVRASAGSGSIRAYGVSGGFRGHAGSGNVEFRGAGAGNVDAETGSGHIRVEGVKGTLRAETGSGGIEADGQPTGTWDLQSGSGSVRVRVPQDAAFEIYAHTGSGGISLGLPVTVEGKIDKHEIRGKVRGGGQFALNVRTGSGGIHIND